MVKWSYDSERISKQKEGGGEECGVRLHDDGSTVQRNRVLRTEKAIRMEFRRLVRGKVAEIHTDNVAPMGIGPVIHVLYTTSDGS